MIKALENKTSMLFNLGFANSTILSCFFFFLLIIELYFLIPVVIAKSFNLIAKIVIPIGIASKKGKAGTEIHPVISEAKIKKYSI